MSNELTIVGLGPGNPGMLTVDALEALKSAEKLILRTKRHGCTEYLTHNGIEYSSLDNFYEESDDFDIAYESMIDYIKKQLKDSSITLGIPGNPMVGEVLVYKLIEQLDKNDFDLRIIPGISRSTEIMAITKKCDVNGINVMMASELELTNLNPRISCIVMGLNSRVLASEVKLILTKLYDDDHRVILSNEIDGNISCEVLSLHEIDRHEKYDHTTSIYLPPTDIIKTRVYDFNHLVEIMRLLRSPEGCPWDREQTHESLKQYLIEETYEVIEAIDKEDQIHVEEELGDLILQVVFHSQIASEKGEFDAYDVISRVCNKMIDRHTHIFGDDSVNTSDEVLSTWEKNKKKEKGLKTQTQVLKDVPSCLPALMRAYKVQKKAADVGFDWDNVNDVMSKVEEELEEIKEVYNRSDIEKIAEEIGDLLFSVVNLARFYKLQPELLLSKTSEKFINRFEFVEKNADKPLEEMTLDEMDKLWNKAKLV